MPIENTNSVSLSAGIVEWFVKYQSILLSDPEEKEYPQNEEATKVN